MSPRAWHGILPPPRGQWYYDGEYTATTPHTHLTNGGPQ